MQDFDTRAYRLLEAVYDLSGGNPVQPVGGDKAAEKAGIPFTTEGYDPLVHHLTKNELVDFMGTVGTNLLRITPEGIRFIEQNEPPTFMA